MAGAKIVVLYPAPRDVNAFDRAYTHDHAPMVTPENFKGMTIFTASKIVGTADGSARPFQRIAELHFPSMAVLQAAAGSLSGQKAVAHASSISTRGAPICPVADAVCSKS